MKLCYMLNEFFFDIQNRKIFNTDMGVGHAHFFFIFFFVNSTKLRVQMFMLFV